MYAALTGNKDILKALLKKNPNVNLQNGLGKTALMLSSKADIASTLIENGADPDIRAFNNDTALHIVAYEGYNDVVKVLVEYVSDINVRGSFGDTALRVAAGLDHIDVVYPSCRIKLTPMLRDPQESQP